MSSDYGVYGWERYDGFVLALQTLGTPHTEHPQPGEPWTFRIDTSGGYGYGEAERPLRQLHFYTSDGTPMIAEEYLAISSLQYGSRVGLAVYPAGQRPRLSTHHPRDDD